MIRDIEGPIPLQEKFAKCFTIILTREEILSDKSPNGVQLLDFSVKLTGTRVEEMYSAEIPQVSSEFSLSRVKMSEIPRV